MPKRKYKQGPFSDDEVELIRRLFPRTETLEIAARLNRSNNSVKAKLREFGLHRQSENIWSSREIALLKKLYPTTSTRAIANRLGFKPSQVRRKARDLGLKKNSGYFSQLLPFTQPRPMLDVPQYACARPKLQSFYLA